MVRGRNHILASKINIMEQLNGDDINHQSTAIEVDRLTSTCTALNLKISQLEYLQSEVPRLQAQNEAVKAAREAANRELELAARENGVLREKNDLLQKRCTELQKQLDDVGAECEKGQC